MEGEEHYEKQMRAQKHHRCAVDANDAPLDPAKGGLLRGGRGSARDRGRGHPCTRGGLPHGRTPAAGRAEDGEALVARDTWNPE